MLIAKECQVKVIAIGLSFTDDHVQTNVCLKGYKILPG